MSSKYHARKTEIDGYIFDSKREAARYAELVLLEKAGEISELECQPKIEINVNEWHICNYFADFVYMRDGEKVYEDAKGVKTDVYRLKKKLVWACHEIDIQEV
jgi:hypothetical protein